MGEVRLPEVRLGEARARSLRPVPEATVPDISLVIPIFNERATLSLLLDEIESAMAVIGRRWEALLIDDGSSDGTFGELVELTRDRQGFTTVRLRRNFGKAAALACGFRHAKGQVVVTMDSDLQDDPAEISRLLVKLDEGYDVASGWKEHRRDPWSRRFASRIFNGLVSRVTGLRLRDVNCGLKAYRREVLADVRLYGELHRFVPVLAHFEGFRIAEVAVNHRERQAGRSRYGLERYVRGIFDLLTVTFFGRYRYRPLHLFGGVGLAAGSAGVLVCAYLTILKLTGSAIGHRPLLILGALLIVVGVQMTLMGLLAEMFTRQHEERRPGSRRLEAELIISGPAGPAPSSGRSATPLSN